ncbi:1-phosphatidylinositol-3-phosphate 5-kinase [Ceratobasidium theobromae]|uniref:1-phosphatidylinositol-3-phosphate 5-kinase n=1 Tax=Ceratobasidium theobromae TaxID=1582974 RepID=A0A5N5QTT1_9AGAM|nr:1-phosphatidylinositol-3-phosphate 5-kinase [Ceratobasidium theobromae]
MESPVTLTTHNPFGDDDPAAQGGYALVTSLLSKVKNTFANGPSATATSSSAPTNAAPSTSDIGTKSVAKPTTKPLSKPALIASVPPPVRAPSLKPATKSLKPGGSNPAPPLVSFAPIAVEQPRYIAEGAYASPQAYEGGEGAYGTSIPGFAIPDDARSVRTTASTRRGVSVSKVIRRLRGEGLSRDYWMDDEHCKECYDCKSVFTTWRRKHHCRVCGQIFCSRCAANIISSSRFGQEGMIRVCNLCLQVLEDEGLDDDDDKRSVASAATSAIYHPGHHHQHSLSFSQSYQPQSPFSAITGRQSDEPFSLFSLGDITLRRRLRSGTRDSDDSRPQTPTDNLFSPGPAPVPTPAPFRRAPNEDELETEGAGIEEKELEMYLERPGRSDGAGEGKGGKDFVFPGPKPDALTPGALQLETGATTLDHVATVTPNPTITTPNLSTPNPAATTDMSTPNTESSIVFPASASSPETPGGLVPPPGLGMRRDSASAFGRERPRLSSGEYIRLNSAGNRLDSFHGSQTPYLRSRVPSRLGEFSPISAEGEAGWRTRRESSAYAAELNAVSMFHLRIMIRQLLARAQIGQPRDGLTGAAEVNDGTDEKSAKLSVVEKNVKSEWEDTLLRLSLKLASRLNVASSPNGANADMDVRHFVKIKKIPGGRPKDSEYIDGAVISSNLAHKKMKRHLHNPRIMILAFSMEWQRRENEYLTLDSILAQEREYLRGLVARITAQRPHLVLVERTVSRLALEYLMAANVAVARAVQPRSTKFVARMTGAEVVPDIPALHRGPRLGECSRFRVQTFDHHLIPGRRKTFMRFEGCDPHRSGCTIILRGADLDTLKKLKEVMRFIAFIVRNLKMESFLWKDCVVTMPGVTGDAVPTPSLGLGGAGAAAITGANALIRPRAKSFPGLGVRIVPSDTGLDAGHPPARWVSPVLPEPSPVFEDDDPFVAGNDEEDEPTALTRQIEASLRPYLTTFISASATLRFLPPWPVRKMKEADDQLRTLRRERDEQVREQESGRDKEGEETSEGKSMEESEASKESIPSLVVVSPEEEASEPKLQSSKSMTSVRSALSAFSAPSSAPLSPSPRMATFAPLAIISGPPISPPEVRAPSELDLEARLADAQDRHEEMRRVWEWYLRRNKDDFAVEKYQQIAMRTFIIPISNASTSITGSSTTSLLENSQRPCFRPQLVYKSYYGTGDQSLAQFIEDACSTPPNAVCESKTCNVLRIAHTRVFVHNESQVLISTEPWTGRIGAHKFAAPHYDMITTWSLCRICMQNTPLIPLSEEAGRYSFVKFLELYFYPADVLLMHGAGCSHNIYQHHVRYFHFRGMTVRFQTEKITLYEMCFPPTRIRVRPQAQLEFKNMDYTQMLERNAAYWDSVLSRIQVATDAASQLTQTHPEQAQLISTLATEMRERAITQRAQIEQLIYRAYIDSPVTDTLQLGRVRPIWQSIITQFDDEFGRLEKLYLPSGYYAGTEKDFRRSVAQNKIAKYVPGIEIMGSMFNTMDRKVISRFVDPEKHQTGSRQDTGQFISSASEYESNIDSSAEPPISETDARPHSVDLPSHGEVLGSELTKPPASASILADNQLLLDGDLANTKQQEELEGGGSDSTISAPRTRPDISLDVKRLENQGKHSRSGPASAKADQPILGNSQADSPVQEERQEVATGKMPLPSEEYPHRISRLPRRSRPHPTVSDLVKQFQAVLPEDFATGAVGYGPLARRSLLSDSEHEAESQPRRFRSRTKGSAHKSKLHPKSQNTLGSDFERSYAANVAPRQDRDGAGDTGLSRIPAPVQSTTPSAVEAMQSGRSSPIHSTLLALKRPGFSRTTTGSTIRHTNPAALDLPQAARKSSVSSKSIKGKAPSRNPPRDRSIARTASTTGSIRQGTRRMIPGTGTGSKVATQVRQFERISRESEKASRRNAIIRGRRARPVAQAKAKVEIFNNWKDALRDDESDSSDSSSEADDEDDGEEETGKLRVDTLDPILSVSDMASQSVSLEAPAPNADLKEKPMPEASEAEKCEGQPEPKPEIAPERLVVYTPESSLPPSPFIRPIREHQLAPSNYSENEMSPGDRLSFLYRVSSAAMSRMQSREHIAMNLAYPVAPTDHVFAESYITVREDEPTSIIALTLSAHDYKVNMAKALSSKQNKSSEKPEAFMPDDISVGDAPSTWGIISHDDLPDPADVLKHPQTVSHQTYSYQSGDVTVTCKVLYAEQFQALRRSCDCDQTMIESLARCVKWDASGGKSGSAFLKTRDERFIAKELSRQEANYMGTFAPMYFEYISSALSEGRPSLLAKLFGFYQISLKNPMAGKSVKMNLLVMENLLYNRKFSHVYDLKGLTRNRMVQRTGRENEVLLDENLVQASHTEPYYLREHAKRILRGAIRSDTEFLAGAKVMDYSMVVGVDKVKNELVVGIVDFVRSYTWDKKIENLMKETVLGGANKGEGPTIVTPSLYKERFRTAMEQYFPLVPDRWMKIQDSPDTLESDKPPQRL